MSSLKLWKAWFSCFVVLLFLLAGCSDAGFKGEVSAKDKSAFITAAGRGNINTVKKFLNRGMDVNITMGDGSGLTALMVAALGGYEKVVKELLSAGADVNMKDSQGWTALMVAAMGNDREIVDLLVEAGASKYIRNNDGKTALDIARDNGFSGLF